MSTCFVMTLTKSLTIKSHCLSDNFSGSMGNIKKMQTFFNKTVNVRCAVYFRF